MAEDSLAFELHIVVPRPSKVALCLHSKVGAP